MTKITWKTDKSGNWSTGANWSSGGVPGPADSVTIDTAHPRTITHTTGNSTAAALDVAAADTLDVKAGRIAVSGQAAIAGSVMESGGTLSLGGGSDLGGGFTQTGGTLAIRSGALTLSGASSLGGSVTGAGTLVTSASTIDGVMLEDGATLRNAGTLLQTGNIAADPTGTAAIRLLNGAFHSWQIESGATIAGGADAIFVNAGRLVTAGDGGTAVIDIAARSTGQIVIGPGMLDFNEPSYDPSYDLGGTISGAGTLELGAASGTLAANLDLATAAILVDGANVALGGDLAFGGEWTSGGTVALGGHTLTLSGQVAPGLIVADGTLLLTGTTEGPVTLIDASLDNRGVLNGSIIPDTAAGAGPSSAVNEAGGTITTSVSVNPAGGRYGLTNRGVIHYTGNGSLAPGLTSTGTLVVDATLALDSQDGALGNLNESNTLGGVVSGAGSLSFSGSVQPDAGPSNYSTLAAGLSLTVAAVSINGGYVLLEGDLTYAGSWTESEASVDLGTSALTLTGSVDFAVVPQFEESARTSFYGTGVVTLAGNTTIGSLSAGSLVNAGFVNQVSLVGYQVDPYPMYAAALVNEAGATYQMQEYAQLYAGTLENSGLLTAQGSPAGATTNTLIDVATINNGTVQVTGGTLTFGSSVAGGGTLLLAANSGMTFEGNVAAGSTAMLGADSTLDVSATAGFGATIADFTHGDVVLLAGLSWNSGVSDSYTPGTGAGGVLSVSNGSASASLNFAGTYTTGSFSLVDNQGNVAVAHS